MTENSRERRHESACEIYARPSDAARAPGVSYKKCSDIACVRACRTGSRPDRFAPAAGTIEAKRARTRVECADSMAIRARVVVAQIGSGELVTATCESRLGWSGRDANANVPDDSTTGGWCAGVHYWSLYANVQ